MKISQEFDAIVGFAREEAMRTGSYSIDAELHSCIDVSSCEDIRLACLICQLICYDETSLVELYIYALEEVLPVRLLSYAVEYC